MKNVVLSKSTEFPSLLSTTLIGITAGLVRNATLISESRLRSARSLVIKVERHVAGDWCGAATGSSWPLPMKQIKIS